MFKPLKNLFFLFQITLIQHGDASFEIDQRWDLFNAIFLCLFIVVDFYESDAKLVAFVIDIL